MRPAGGQVKHIGYENVTWSVACVAPIQRGKAHSVVSKSHFVMISVHEQ